MDNNTKILIGVGAVCAVLAYLIYNSKNPKTDTYVPVNPLKPVKTDGTLCKDGMVKCNDNSCDELKITLSGIHIPCKDRGGVKSSF